jgi:signal transduction histidine kinase/ligand-binding sensor domain-containing protein/DNA-binding response OmpR family regulator
MFRISKIHLQFIFIFSILSVSLFAQKNNFRFERITTENGLSKNNVYSIAQDSLGFMWFATDYGLNRYDGYNIKQYFNIENDTTSLGNNYVSGLLVDKLGNLWVGTNGFLHLYNSERDNFKRFQLKPDPEKDQGIQIVTITEGDKGNIWVGNLNGGLYQINPTSGNITNFTNEVNKIRISSIYQDTGGELWIGGDMGQLFKFNKQKKNFAEHYDILLLNPDLLHDNFIWFINELSSDLFLIGTARGLYTFNKKTTLFNTYDIDGYSSENYSFKSYFKDSLGPSWFGTFAKGLFLVDDQTLLLERKPNNMFSLSNNEIRDIFRDKGGVFWVATMGGVNKLDPAKLFFQHFQNDPQNLQTLTSNNISSFCEDENKNIWIGTMGGGIDILNTSTKQISPLKIFLENMDGGMDEEIFDLAASIDGNIWIGTRSALHRYNQTTNKFYKYDHNDYNPEYFSDENLDKMDGKAILSLSIDMVGNLWIGTYGGGIACAIINRQTQSVQFSHFKNIENEPNSLSSNYIRKIYVDRFGIVWIGTLGSGLDRFDPTTNTFKHYTFNKENEFSLSNNYVTEIYEDHFGNLWIGTYLGLNKFDRENQTFTQHSINEKEPYRMISELYLDKNYNLWITTDNGLYRNNVKNNTVKKYSIGNGLQGNNFNINALYSSTKGEMYIGGRNGFNVFNPNDFEINNQIPNVVITSILVDNKPVEFGIKNNNIVINKQNLSSGKGIQLTYRNKIISVKFAALSYSLNNQNRYAYKMEGLNDEWIFVDSDMRVATFTNLTDGDYTLKIKASNNDDVWNEIGTSLNIKMKVPYWRTWWANLFYGLLILGIMMLILKSILIKRKLENELFAERIEREKIIEMNQMKIDFFSNISHEFRTPLTLIISPIESILKKVSNPELTNKLELIQRNAVRLLNLVNQLLDFRKSETDKWNLNTEQIDLIDFIEEVKSSFNELAAQKQITFQLILEHPRPLTLWFDPQKMKSVFYNLLSNAFKYTSNGKKISIVIRKENLSIEKKLKFIRRSISSHEEYIVIDFIDEGIGIDKEKIQYIFDSFYTIGSNSAAITSTGIGLALVKNIMILHHGRIEVDSAPGKGSKFSVFIPHDDTNKNPEIKLEISEKDNYETDEIKSEDEKPNNINLENNLIVEFENNADTQYILVVEDDDDIRQYIVDELKHDFKFKEATNGVEGFAIAQETVPDLIISDVIMPEMDGIELCNKLKEDITTNHIPVIILTAKSSDEDKLKGLKHGADSYLTKPFNIDLLKANINNLLKSRSKLREKYSSELMIKPRDIVIESRDGELLTKLIEIIENNMHETEFDVKTLADEAGLSRMQLYRKLKALINKTPHELINTFRMERAAQILIQKQMTVSEVAYEVGFNTPKYFSRCFKEQFGMLPTKYIKEHSKKSKKE